jgi:hypothetical protein
MRCDNESTHAFLHRIQPPFGDVKLPATLKVCHLAKPESRIDSPLLPERAKRKLGMFVTSRAFRVFNRSAAPFECSRDLFHVAAFSRQSSTIKKADTATISTSHGLPDGRY